MAYSPLIGYPGSLHDATITNEAISRIKQKTFIPGCEAKLHEALALLSTSKSRFQIAQRRSASAWRLMCNDFASNEYPEMEVLAGPSFWSGTGVKVGWMRKPYSILLMKTRRMHRMPNITFADQIDVSGIGEPMPALRFSLSRLVIIYLPLAWGLSWWLGLNGVYIATMLANGVVGGVAIVWSWNKCAGGVAEKVRGLGRIS